MATFEARVEAITGLDIDGSSVPSQDDVTEFLKDAVNEYTNIHINARPADAEYFIRESALSDTQAALSADSGKIISVVRESGTALDYREARQIKQGSQSRVTDESSLEFASKFNPAYMVTDDGAVHIFPAPGANPNRYKIYYINGTPTDSSGASLLYSHSAIKYFPEDAVSIVILYTAIKCIEVKLSVQSLQEEDQELVSALVPLLNSLKEDYKLALSSIIPQRGQE
tara:strand:+ start:1606 stop:2286 length:681 start_codon:yes stop_codon:yes gene_type:complete